MGSSYERGSYKWDSTVLIRIFFRRGTSGTSGARSGHEVLVFWHSNLLGSAFVRLRLPAAPTAA